MVLVDVGAHIGEFTLLAAQAVGVTGQVHAFEPQPNLFPVLSENVQMNGLSNVILNCSAVSDHVGDIEFEICDEPTLSSIRKHTTSALDSKLVRVACTSLDTYWTQEHPKIDLIKVDVEGAEKFVFEGAKRLLSLPATEAPTWLFEYVPANYACFDYQPSELLELLKHYGYEVWLYCGAGQIGDFDPDSHPSAMFNLIAAKDKNYLLSQIKHTSSAATPNHVSV
jgi:FkbM family methyltransferase